METPAPPDPAAAPAGELEAELAAAPPGTPELRTGPPDRTAARQVTRELLRGCLPRVLAGAALGLLGGAALLASRQGASVLASLLLGLGALLLGAGFVAIAVGRRRRARIRAALEPLGFQLEQAGQGLSFAATVDDRPATALVAPGPGLALRLRCAGGQELLAGPQAAVALGRLELGLQPVDCAATAAGHAVAARDPAWASALLADPAASASLCALLAAPVGEPGAGVSIDAQGLLFWSGRRIPGGLATDSLREWLAALAVLAAALESRSTPTRIDPVNPR